MKIKDTWITTMIDNITKTTLDFANKQHTT